MSTDSTSPGPYRSSPESLAIIDQIVADAPPLSLRQIRRIEQITGMTWVPKDEDYEPGGLLAGP